MKNPLPSHEMSPQRSPLMHRVLDSPVPSADSRHRSPKPGQSTFPRPGQRHQTPYCSPSFPNSGARHPPPSANQGMDR